MEAMKLSAYKCGILIDTQQGDVLQLKTSLLSYITAAVLSKGHASAFSIRLVPDIFLSIKYVL